MSMNIELGVRRLIAAADDYRSGTTKTPPDIYGNLLLELGCLTPPEALDRTATNPENLDYLLKLIIELAPCDWATSKFAPLLSGVFYKHGLTHCVASEDGAYALAVMLVGYMETDFPETFMLITTAKPHVRTLLRQWVLPATDGMSMPSVATVCRALFTEDWCSLMLPESANQRGASAKGRRRPISDLIATTRPAFLPGRCAGQVAPVAVDLPANLSF